MNRTVSLLGLAALATLLPACSTVSRIEQPYVKNSCTFDHEGIIRGPQSRRVLALVFTGGDYGEGTQTILDALARYQVKGSFFVTGDYLAGPQHRDYVRRMVAEGHYVGPHSDTHPLYCAWEDRNQTLVEERFFRDDLQDNIDDLRSLGALPEGQVVYFVPPYEWYNAEQVRWARSMGVTLCSFTPGSGSNRDWIPEGRRGFVSSARIRTGIFEYELRDPAGLSGFLLLLHLGSQRADKMHDEVGPLIEALTRRGYRFVRVDELLEGCALREPVTQD